MKNFIYTITDERGRREGGINTNGIIYRIKNNTPYKIADFHYCTAYYKGPESEILTAIASNTKELTKKEKSYFPDLYYYWSVAEKIGISITRV